MNHPPYEQTEFEMSIHRAASVEIERVTYDDSKWVKLVITDIGGMRNVINVFGTNGVCQDDGQRAAEVACDQLRKVNANLRREIDGTDHAMFTESLCADISTHQSAAGRLRSELEIVGTVAEHALAMLNRIDEGEALSAFDDGALNHMNQQMNARSAGQLELSDGRDHDCPECGKPVFEAEVAYCSRTCVRQANQDDPEARS